MVLNFFGPSVIWFDLTGVAFCACLFAECLTVVILTQIFHAPPLSLQYMQKQNITLFWEILLSVEFAFVLANTLSSFVTAHH